MTVVLPALPDRACNKCLKESHEFTCLLLAKADMSFGARAWVRSPASAGCTARNRPVGELRNRVVRVRRFGGPDGLEVVDAPLPAAGRGEVRVRVLASGLEYTDVLIR